MKDSIGFHENFLNSGEVPVCGDLFYQKQLSNTLERLAHAGLDDFYRGDLAK